MGAASAGLYPSVSMALEICSLISVSISAACASRMACMATVRFSCSRTRRSSARTSSSWRSMRSISLATSASNSAELAAVMSRFVGTQGWNRPLGEYEVLRDMRASSDLGAAARRASSNHIFPFLSRILKSLGRAHRTLINVLSLKESPLCFSGLEEPVLPNQYGVLAMDPISTEFLKEFALRAPKAVSRIHHHHDCPPSESSMVGCCNPMVVRSGRGGNAPAVRGFM
jgi:hypothetical protein